MPDEDLSGISLLCQDNLILAYGSFTTYSSLSKAGANKELLLHEAGGF